MATIPLRNTIYEIIKNAGAMTDSELSKALTKAGISIPEDEFNKTLLNLEIYGLIKVTWLTKDERRVEIFVKEAEEDEIEKQNRESLEKEYEAGFPGVEQETDIEE
ncbi:MAG: hypothetical protein KGH89_06595 [Thaumarchaeota archaeon]|nr:hypothetical protein [Nitrososphaerota archaeon]MDE1866931.1 hypothetical protein [Nitrososphaerota archaeon]